MVRRSPAARATRALVPAAVTGSPIGVAARRTGIPEETLRAWERRYGFPSPQRRSGGSRLYSEADIVKLQLLGRALVAGFRPGDVIHLAVAELTHLTETAVRDRDSHAPLATPVGRHDAVAQVLTALREDDVVSVRELLHGFAVQFGPKAFVTECAHPLIVHVGAAWAEGQLDVRHEHLASAFLQTELRSMLAAIPDLPRAKILVLTTLPEEPHSLPLDMVAVYISALGMAARLLGTSTPADQIAAAAIALRADAVGVSVSSQAPRTSTQHELKSLRAALPPTVQLWVGGSGARELAPTSLGVRVVDTWARIDEAARALGSMEG